MPRTMIITGASSGIGAALAELAADRGYSVGVIARRADRLQTLTSKIQAAGGSAAWATADVTDADGVQQAIDQLEAALGPCDTLVANAGILMLSTSHKLRPERVLDQMRVNFDGVVHSIHAVLPGMLERQSGRICAVSSVAGFRGIGNWAGYSATKAAVNALMESYRIELGPEGIVCTTICPGYIASEMTDGFSGPKPFMISSERAARHILAAVEDGASQVVFPWQMAGLMGVAKVLPNWLWDRMQRPSVKRFNRRPR